MLNIVATDKVPNFQHSKMMDQFLMNTLAFSVGSVTKDYSSFDPLVLEMIEEDSKWLHETTIWCQSTVVGSLLDGGSYETVEEIINEFDSLLKLYSIATGREFTPSEENLFLSLHDKFVALLLTDQRLIDYLLKGE